MMLLSSHAYDLIVAPLNIVHLFIQAPSSTTTLGPIVTFGPILQFFPILAVGSTKTFPTIPIIKKIIKAKKIIILKELL